MMMMMMKKNTSFSHGPRSVSTSPREITDEEKGGTKCGSVERVSVRMAVCLIYLPTCN